MAWIKDVAEASRGKPQIAFHLQSYKIFAFIKKTTKPLSHERLNYQFLMYGRGSATFTLHDKLI